MIGARGGVGEAGFSARGGVGTGSPGESMPAVPVSNFTFSGGRRSKALCSLALFMNWQDAAPPGKRHHYHAVIGVRGHKATAYRKQCVNKDDIL